MKLLVIGGSYFLGRVFVMLAFKEHEITVVNRGNIPLAGMPVKELRADRHDASFFRTLTEDFDAIVDFCAYAPLDVSVVLENLGGTVKQYLLVSTVDVYAHGNEAPDYQRREDYPTETVRYAGEIGDYIAGKAAAEQELFKLCEKKGIYPVILRPSVIYGPMNYAPREQVFMECIRKNHTLPKLVDANGCFQMVYVKDAAEAIMACLGNEKAYGECFNIAGDELITYDMFTDTLVSAMEVDIKYVPLTLQEAEKQGFLISFPIKKEENHLCDNRKSKEILEMRYTTLLEGLRRTIAAYPSGDEPEQSLHNS